jgi:hypothetical protein
MSSKNFQIVNKEEELKKKYLKYKQKYNNLKIFLQKGGLNKPWTTDSQLLYIALVVDPKSEVGEVIEHRTKGAIKRKAFSNYGSGNLKAPHLSLLQIYIPDKSNLDEFIRGNLQIIYDIIKLSFMNNLNKLTIHSALGQYAKLGNFLTRHYNDTTKDMYQTIKQRQTAFRIAIESFLLTQIPPVLTQIGQTFATRFNIETGIAPTQGKGSYTHYSQYDEKYPNSVMAENDHSTTSWEPHITLFPMPVTPVTGEDAVAEQEKLDKDTIDTFTKQGLPEHLPTANMSYLNLWKNTTSHNGYQGSFSHIFVSYGGIHHWIPL